MSIFAPEKSDDDALLRQGAGGSDSDTFANRPDHGIIEEEDDGGTERSYSEAARSDADGDQANEDMALPQVAESQVAESQVAPPQAAPPQAAAAVPQQAGPGLFSRAWGGFKRGMASMGRGLSEAFGFSRLFGRTRPAPDPNDPGEVAAAEARREYQGGAGRQVGDTRARLIAGPRMSWMERLFGAAPGGRTVGNQRVAAARLAAETAQMREVLDANRFIAPGARPRPVGGAPGVAFLRTTPNNVHYGTGKNAEQRPVGYTPNASWAVKPHAPAPSEQIGAHQGTSMAGSMPSDAVGGLKDARRKAEETGQYTAPGLIRGADEPELRASEAFRKAVARRIGSEGLKPVDPRAVFFHRANRTAQKAGEALGNGVLIPEETEQEAEDDGAPLRGRGYRRPG